jgi:lipopolysaccharide/colanic/teichoic acid biosynthesis glycosyltransferase
MERKESTDHTGMNGTPSNPNSSVMAGIPRPVEAVAAFAGLIIAAPVLALAALGIALTSRGRIIFRQSRVGRDGRIFVLYKFRTMLTGQVGPQVTAGDDSRITYVGKLLRKTKMDELPELWNVLKGDMSLVGPRPEVPRYVDLNNSKWQRVLKVRPGITDPLTLRLRNEEELLAKVKGDRERFYLETLQPFKLRGYLEYLHRRSWQNDLKILWNTCLAVIFSKSVSHPPMNEILACTEEGGRSNEV